jgi:hypothetical protein
MLCRHDRTDECGDAISGDLLRAARLWPCIVALIASRACEFPRLRRCETLASERGGKPLPPNSVSVN